MDIIFVFITVVVAVPEVIEKKFIREFTLSWSLTAHLTLLTLSVADGLGYSPLSTLTGLNWQRKVVACHQHT